MSVSRALFNEALNMLNNNEINPNNWNTIIHNIAKPDEFSLFLVYSFLKMPNNGLTDDEKNNVRTIIYNYARDRNGWVISSYLDYLSENNFTQEQMCIDGYINTIFINNTQEYNIRETYAGNDAYNIPYATVVILRELLADGF